MGAFQPHASQPGEASASRAASAEHARMLRRASYAAVLVALTLILAKGFAAWITDSVSMLSSLVDSLLDALASTINLLAIRHSLTPADEEHRFGHGKAEAVAGLGQAAFVAGSSVFLLFESGNRLFNQHPVERGEVGILVMCLSIALTFGLVLYQRRVVKATGSVAIGADSLHYRGDLLVNLSVIIGIGLAIAGYPLADPVIALVIALYIMKGAFDIARQSFDHLMDRELPNDMRDRIREIVMRHPAALDMHDLRTRGTGSQAFIQFHLELDPDITLRRAHDISDAIEAELMVEFPGAEIIIHQDPAGIVEQRPDFASR